MKKKYLFSLFVFALFINKVNGQGVTPQLNGSKCYFQIANVYFEVDPTYGGRITSLKLNNKQILFTNTSTNWGSTFWQSPQSAWGWPPSTALDQNAYSGGILGDSVNILSQVDNTYNTKLKFRKIFYANLADTSITIEYFMINTGTSAKSFAPWEITRVPVGGMIFFPDTGGVSGVLAPKFEKIGKLQWLDYSSAKFSTSTIKSFSNSIEGWSAWLNSDSAVFIKKFDKIKISEAASGEDAVEDYYDGPASYYEIENQGKYVAINASDSLKWVMKWYVRKLPANVDKSKGSVELANFVRSIVGAPLDTANKDTTHTVVNFRNKTVNFTISPNPCSNYIRLSGPEKGEIVISDICGRIMLKTSFNKNQEVISIGQITSGIYFYSVVSSGLKYSGKLIVKK